MYGRTPLFVTSQLGQLKVIKRLVEEGEADVEKAAIIGFTPLQIAKQEKKEGIVKYLKGKGAMEGNQDARVPQPDPQ